MEEALWFTMHLLISVMDIANRKSLYWEIDFL